MITGTSVRFIPAAIEPIGLRKELEALGELIGKVYFASTSGECVVELPEGITILGYSVEFPDGEGRHYINVNRSHLEEVVPVLV